MVELIKLEIEGFGKFDKKKTIDFNKGINFINGLNEAGKSTILEAILASLFKYTNSKIEPFFCWTNPDICKLSLTYKTDENQTFKIISDYKNSSKKLVKITNSGTSDITTVITKIHEYIKEHFGFDEQKVFENTTFIRQSQMAILGDAGTKNKLKDMIEEVLVGSAEASATKALKKIKKIAKDSKKEAISLKENLLELKEDLETAEENKHKLSNDSKQHDSVSNELKTKSEKLIKLKDNKKLFDEKERLLNEEKSIDKNISQIDDMIETLEEEKEPDVKQSSKTMPIILIIVGAIFSFVPNGFIIGIPLILFGIYKLVKKEEPKNRERKPSDKLDKYKKEKKDLINQKAVVESKLEKYKLVNFTLDNFRDLEKLEEEVDKLKTKNIELKKSISTTKNYVKSQEEIQEEYDIIENKINLLNEKSEEHELASFFLEKSEMEVQQKFTPAIQTNSKHILQKITNNKYSDIKINEEDLNTSVKAPEIDEYVPVDVLSQGTKDQIYFTIRTTMTDLLSGNINIPMIFDDPFHNFDDIRLGKTIEAIKELSKTKQIILISHKNYQKDFKNFADNLIEV